MGSVHRSGLPSPVPTSTTLPLRAVRSTQADMSLSPGGWTTKVSPSSQEVIRASSRRVSQVPTVSEVVGGMSSSV